MVNSLVLHHLGHGDLHVKGDIARLDGHTVHFKDGSAKDYDLILCATGYRLHYPFMDVRLFRTGRACRPSSTSTSFAPIRQPGRDGHDRSQWYWLARPVRAG